MTTLKEAGCSTRLANALIAEGMTEIETVERLMSIPGGFDTLRRVPNLGPVCAAELHRICEGRKVVVMSHHARMRAFREELSNLTRAARGVSPARLDDSKLVLIKMYESEVKKNG